MNDPGIPDFNQITWGASSPWIKGSYYRLYYQINVANAFLRETTEDKLNSRGASETLKDSIKIYRAEARLLRAMTYEYALDLYRNVPFVTEDSPIGNVLPQQIMAKDHLISLNKSFWNVKRIFLILLSVTVRIMDMPRNQRHGRYCPDFT
jgi:hypothetical protein